MNQTNQLQGESKHYTLWYEEKCICKSDKKTKVCT